MYPSMNDREAEVDVRLPRGWQGVDPGLRSGREIALSKWKKGKDHHLKLSSALHKCTMGHVSPQETHKHICIMNEFKNDCM